MRKIVRYALIFVWLFSILPFSTQARNAEKKEKKNVIKSEKVEAIGFQPLLQGVNYVRVRCQFNGTLYYQGYHNPRDVKKQEFNLKTVEKQFKEAAIPLAKNHVQELYGRVETELKNNGLRILDIQTTDEKDATVIPYITLVIDILTVSKESYFLAIDLTVTKWMSTWSGETSVQAPVIVWWQKKIATATATDLIGTLDKTAQTMLENLTTQLTYANAKTGDTVKPTPQSKPENKNTKPKNKAAIQK